MSPREDAPARLWPPLALLALLLAPALPGVASGTPPFTPPPLRAGESASYEGSSALVLSVGGPLSVLDKAGRSVEARAIVATTASQTREFALSPATGLVERVRYPCIVRDGSACLDEADWSFQGIPALFGATLLQGRSFRVGDAWTVPACARCLTPIRVSIQAPDAASPPGTAYVANVTASYVARDWAHAQGLLHMGSAHAFPLKVAMPGRAYVLVSHVAGAEAVPVSSTGAASYPASPLARPLEQGHPPEGTPIEGHPSWRSAREATGDSGPSEGTLVLLDYSWSNATVEWPSQGVSTTSHARLIWESRTARPGQPDALRTYETTRPMPGVVPDEPVPDSWSRTETFLSPTTTGACVGAMVPFWDLARQALATPYLHGFDGLTLHSASCATYRLYVWGAARAGYVETLSLDPATGHLAYALTWES